MKLKQRTHLLIPLLAISMLALPVCKGAVVFSDDFSEAPGTLIIGKSPDVGGAWTGTGNGVTVSSVNSLDTAGISIQVFGGFTAALGAGQILTLQYDTLAPASGTFLNNNTSWAGVSLYTGHTTGTSGNERMFTGNPSAGFWGTDGSAIGRHFGTDNTEATHATFTYVYNTGAWTFSTASGYTTNGTGTANLALNAFRVGNGTSYINVDNLVVDISAVPVVSFVAQTPAPGYSGSRTNISVEATDGNAPVNTNTIVMKVDGSTVTPSITKSANITTISYAPVSPFNAGTLHTVLVTLADSNAALYTNTWSFTTGYPTLPLTMAGPFAVSNGIDLTILTAAGEGWLGTNYNASSSRTLYARFSMTFHNTADEPGNGGGGCYGGLHFFDGGTERLLTGETWLRTTWSVDTKLGGGLAGEPELNPATTVVSNEWHTLVTRVDYTPGGSATATIWLDPDFSQTEANQPNAPLVETIVNTFDNIRLRCGNTPSAAEFTNIVIAALGTDVGFAVPADPQFQGFVPGVNAPSAPINTPISVEVVVGSVGIRTNNITLSLDGSPVTPVFSTSGNIITVSYQPASPFSASSSHSVSVNLTDTNGTPYSTSWSFTVDAYPSLPVTLAGPVDVTGGGGGITIFSNLNGWISGNYQSTSTNTLYTRFSMTFFDVNGETGGGGAFGGLHFFQDNTEHLLTGNNWGSTNWSAEAQGSGAPDLLPITPIMLGEWHTMVVKSVYSANANTAETIWLDPDFTKSEANQPQAPLTISMDNTFNNIRLRCGNGGAFAEFTNVVIAATAPEVGFAVQPPTAVLSIQNSGGNVNLSWTSTGTLEEALAVTGPWTDAVNQANPQVLATTNSARFFRLRQ